MQFWILRCTNPSNKYTWQQKDPKSDILTSDPGGWLLSDLIDSRGIEEINWELKLFEVKAFFVGCVLILKMFRKIFRLVKLHKFRPILQKKYNELA